MIMNKNLPPLLIIILIICVFFPAQSQSDRFAYAVTDREKQGSVWIVLRKLDFKKGEFSNIILDGTNRHTILYDAESKSKFESSIKDTSKLFRPELAFGSSVAALAYDRKNNRLFFTPMYVDQLRYVDLLTMKIFCVNGKGFNNIAASKVNPANVLARMVIAGDGYGYTISNDGNHLFRFTTSGVPVISDMGSLKDDPANNEMTIHNSCTNAGGDMIADDAGNLYLITAQNRVYKVTIRTLQARYLGKISGLPEKFSSNGAVVDDEGKVLVSSSIFRDAYYKVDPVTWKAVEYKPKNGVYNCADFANSNILVTRKSTSNNTYSVINFRNTSQIKLYPNPAGNNLFMIQFTNLKTGDYTIQLTDILGRNLLQKKIFINSGSHTETVKFSSSNTKGVYMVKVVNKKNKQIFIQKLWVEKLSN